METLPKQIVDSDPLLQQSAITQEIQKNTEIQPVLVDSLKVAAHGIAAWVNEKRMNRAGKVMERMDHKDALYEDMSGKAGVVDVGPAETASGQPAKPRTFAERFMDKRAKKKSWKLALRKAQKDWEIEMFGGTGKTKTMSHESKALDSRRRKEVNQRYKSGDLTAQQRSIELDKIRANPSRTENARSRQLTRQQNRAEKRLTRTTDQPLLSRWRSARRNRAISVIKSSHNRSEKHRTSLEQTRQVLTEKKASNRRIRTINTLRKLTPERPKQQNLDTRKSRIDYKTAVGADGIARNAPVRPKRK